MGSLQQKRNLKMVSYSTFLFCCNAIYNLGLNSPPKISDHCSTRETRIAFWKKYVRNSNLPFYTCFPVPTPWGESSPQGTGHGPILLELLSALPALLGDVSLKYRWCHQTSRLWTAYWLCHMLLSHCHVMKLCLIVIDFCHSQPGSCSSLLQSNICLPRNLKAMVIWV